MFLEELSAVGSDMSVLIATQHFYTTASKMVSQAVRSSYWPPGAPGGRYSAPHCVGFAGSCSVRVIDADSASAGAAAGIWSVKFSGNNDRGGCSCDGSAPPLGLIFITQPAPLKAAVPRSHSKSELSP